MNSLLFTLFYFFLALGILIAVHEYGHFWVARTLGVKVLRFSLGFGKTLWSKTSKGGTEFVLAAIPLGGYIKMLDEAEAPVPKEELPYAFNQQSLWVRSAIVLAGPMANFLFAIFAFWIIFSLGENGTRPIIATVGPGTIAEAAGFQAGDEIISIDEEPIPAWEVATIHLLDHAVGGDTVNILVQSSQGIRTNKSLHLDNAQEWIEQGALMSKIGLHPWSPPALIGKLVPKGAAEQAGILSDDLILQADGQAIANWREWVQYVQKRPGQTLQLQLERQGIPQTLALRLDSYQQDDKLIGRAGVYLAQAPLQEMRVTIDYPPWQALTHAVKETWRFSTLTLQILGKILIGEASVKNLSGPISIAKYAGETASYGLVSFLKFLALVSISLGVINLLPVPILDGGHLLYFFIEAIKGSPVSEKARLFGQQIGLILLFALMGLAFYVDIARWLG